MLRSTVLNALKGASTRMPLARQALWVRRLCPRRRWYGMALRAARLQGAMVARMGGNGPFTTALMLDFWLRELSFGGAFPLPVRLHGAEVLRGPEPKLYTWTHLPLTEVPLRALMEAGVPAPAVVADKGKVLARNEFLVFGWPEHVPALPVDAAVLRRVQATLRSGQSVVFLADEFLGGPLSDIPLRLAARLRVPVVFQWAELQADGTLEVTFRAAPFPLSDSDAELEANLAFLRERNREALARLGWRRP